MLRFDIFNTSESAIDNAALELLAQAIWKHESTKEAQINLVLTDDAGIVALNKQYLERDYITDVIAFPIEETGDGFEGEIYVNLQQVRRNAEAFSNAPDEELRRMVAHGILHFLGYCDKDIGQKEEMTRRENFYLSR